VVRNSVNQTPRSHNVIATYNNAHGNTLFTDDAHALLTRIYGPSAAALCILNCYRPASPRQLTRIRTYFADSHRAQGARNVRRAVASRAA
jgi:hypothetical protein